WVQLLARHRARGVEDERVIFGNDFFLVLTEARRREEQKIAFVRTGPVSHQVHADVVSLRGKVDLEVRVRLHVPGFVADGGLVCSVTLDLHIMAWRINGFERALR